MTAHFFSFVCVTNKSTSTPFRLRSYRSPSEPGTHCKIWEAARATSAAPLYFPDIKLGVPPAAYVDGGLNYNNPIHAVYDEAKRIWGKTPRKIQCIVSVGTGVPALKSTGNSGKQIVDNLIDIALNTQRVAEEFLDSMDHLSPDEKPTYVRLDVDNGLKDIKLEEWKSFDLLTSATNHYLNTHRAEISTIVDALIGRKLGR